MSPLCVDQGIGVIPWSPMARGRLTRDPETTTARSETDEFGKTSAAAAVEADGAVIERVAAVAAARGGAAGAGRVGVSRTGHIP